MTVIGGALVLAGLAGLGVLQVELWRRLVALNDAQQAELLSAVAGVGQDVTEAADRVADLIASRDADDPEVTQAIQNLRDIGTRADAIATAAQTPTPDPGGGTDTGPVEPLPPGTDPVTGEPTV